MAIFKPYLEPHFVFDKPYSAGIILFQYKAQVLYNLNNLEGVHVITLAPELKGGFEHYGSHV